jgi:hypothetical protein
MTITDPNSIFSAIEPLSRSERTKSTDRAEEAIAVIFRPPAAIQPEAAPEPTARTPQTPRAQRFMTTADGADSIDDAASVHSSSPSFSPSPTPTLPRARSGRHSRRRHAGPGRPR